MRHNDNTQECIQACWQSRNECQKTLFTHCLTKGGEDLAPDHVRIMMDCISACQLAADAMVRQSPLHADICGLCAKVCAACADSCESIESMEMKKCAQACRRSADLCREMSQKSGNLPPSGRNPEQVFGIGP